MNIRTICDSVSGVIESVRPPALQVPSSLINMGAIFRPGLSALITASKIIARQSEAGAPYGALADGSANIAEAMERIRVEEIINALKYDAQLQITIPPGGIAITATGANSAGPVTVQGTNTGLVKGIGIIV